MLFAEFGENKAEIKHQTTTTTTKKNNNNKQDMAFRFSFHGVVSFALTIFFF